jgi:alkylated DNA repair dioxygenase AlkB
MSASTLDSSNIATEAILDCPKKIGIIYQEIKLKHATLLYYPQFLSSDIADDVKQNLLNELKFEKKPHEGRQTALYGSISRYDYARNVGTVPLPFNDTMLDIKNKLEIDLGLQYNVSLCNYYKNGREQFKYHADNEEIGNSVPIASISLGAERFFDFQSKNIYSPDDREFVRIKLENGSLLVIPSIAHEHYLHRLPADHCIKDCRLNITFRYVVPNKYPITLVCQSEQS